MIGQTILHYKILEKLGEGGMGVVFKAQDLKLGRFVALKFLPPRFTASEADKARFVQEAKAASSINHPNVCTIHDIRNHGKELFIVMEYVEGKTLRDLPLGKLDEATVTTYAVQIGEALQAAHEKGIVHRDVKPDNIMVNLQNQIKVMDFGLAKLRGSLKLTKTTTTVGTLAYMAPEQIEGREVDNRADLFSLGALLFEMLTGSLPFRGDHEAAMMYSILNEDPRRLESSGREFSGGLQHIIERALQKNPSDRYQTAADFVNDLKKAAHTPVQGTVVQVPSPRLPRTPLRRRMLLAGIGLSLIALMSVLYLVFRPHQSIDSLAVLPFVNGSASESSEYLVDGITENVINRLSKISQLTVLARGTVYQYKGPDVDPLKTGRDLGVRAVLTGKVVQVGGEIVISAELVDVSNGAQLWGEQYRRRRTDVLTLQEELAREISQQLRLRITGEEQKQLTKRYTENNEAYQLYLQGLYHWNKRLPEDLHKGIDYFRMALEKDEHYALAYVGLADSYTLLGNFSLLSPNEAFSKAKEASLRAIEIDNTLGEAHASLAYAKMYYDWDPKSAEEEFRKAIELNPGLAMAYNWYALFLSVMKRFEESVAMRKRALDLDPLSPSINTDAGIALYFERKYDEAIQQYQKTLQINTMFVATYIPLGGAYVLKGMDKEAVDSFQKASMFSNGHPISVAGLGYTAAVFGRKEEAMTMVDLLKERRRDEYVSAYWIAVVYCGLGNKKLALEWLQKAYTERDGNMIFLDVEPIFDPLRSNAQFTLLLKKVGLAP
jgi:serine/threonine protein kinase/tetratricopeptide (TPR) repeat protein